MEMTEQRIFWGTFIEITGEFFLSTFLGSPSYKVNYFPQTEDDFVRVDDLAGGKQQVSILGRIGDPVTEQGQLPTINIVAIVSHQDVALRAYEIYESGKGGSAFDNWLIAERQLLGI